MKRFNGICMVLLIASTVASAGIIQVPEPYSTIQAGIDAALEGDTVLVADGTYEGAGNINLDFNGKAIVLLSENGPENCIINCGVSGRGFFFHSGETETSVLSGFTITSGYITNGGGIHITNSSPTIEHCILWNNNGLEGSGGAIYINSGSPVITKCTIVGNASKYGGAIYLTAANPIINSCIIVSNSSSG